MKVGLLKGDGIGPEISDSVVRLFAALKAPIEWEELACGEESIKASGAVLPAQTLTKLRELKVALKGPTGTPIGTGHRSANVTLRKELNLYSNLRPVFNLPGVKTRYENINLVIVRENTEDVYSGNERKVSDDVAECIKTITRAGSQKIVKFAFDYARREKRKKITCVQKANIMKLTDGLFLEVFRTIAKDYPEIEAKEMLVDNACMQLVTRPEQFDIIVTENLYGDILSDLCAGLVGGLGVTGGANIGESSAIFEAVHGTAPDIAGRGVANPTALLLSACMLLDYLELSDLSKRLRGAIFNVLKDGKSLTKDLGGSASLIEYEKAIQSRL